MESVPVLGDREQIIVIRKNGTKDTLVTLRGACRDGIIPRRIEHARMDRHRYRCPDPPKSHQDVMDGNFCDSDGCFPPSEVREGDRDYYDPEWLADWYADHPMLTSRQYVPPRARKRAV